MYSEEEADMPIPHEMHNYIFSSDARAPLCAFVYFDDVEGMCDECLYGDGFSPCTCVPDPVHNFKVTFVHLSGRNGVVGAPTETIYSIRQCDVRCRESELSITDVYTSGDATVSFSINREDDGNVDLSQKDLVTNTLDKIDQSNVCMFVPFVAKARNDVYLGEFRKLVKDIRTSSAPQMEQKRNPHVAAKVKRGR